MLLFLFPTGDSKHWTNNRGWQCIKQSCLHCNIGRRRQATPRRSRKNRVAKCHPSSTKHCTFQKNSSLSIFFFYFLSNSLIVYSNIIGFVFFFFFPRRKFDRWDKVNFNCEPLQNGTALTRDSNGDIWLYLKKEIWVFAYKSSLWFHKLPFPQKTFRKS